MNGLRISLMMFVQYLMLPVWLLPLLPYLGTLEDGTCDVEAAAYGFVTFKGGSCLTLRNSWAEMIKREEMSVTLQARRRARCSAGSSAGTGDDATAEDSCDIYRMTAKGARKDGPLTQKRDESMGRIRCAENFVRVLQGREKPLSDPAEAVKLMRIIDAVYASAKNGRPVKV